jgi:branched-chain amino acid transport system permease protein
MGFLFALFRYSRIGLAMRAAAFDRGAAELVGVPTTRVLMFGWGLSATMGAAAAMLVAPILVLNPNMMFFLLIFAFSAAVLGGLDSALGAMVGGLCLGVVQNIVGTYINVFLKVLPGNIAVTDPNQYRDIIAILLIIVVLAVRPRGIFGRVVTEKV